MKIYLVLAVVLLLLLGLYYLVGATTENFRRRRWGRGRRGWRGRGLGYGSPWRRRPWWGGGWWPYSTPTVTTVYESPDYPDDYSIYKNQQPSEYVTGMYKGSPISVGDALRQCNASSKCQAVVYDDNQNYAKMMQYGNPMDLTDVNSAGIDTYIKN